MALYIVLASFTEQGIRNAKDAPQRGQVVRDLAKKCGCTAKDIYWTLGQYDVVATFDAPDDVAITALGLSIGALGNVRTQTMRAFTADEMKQVVKKLVQP